MCFHCLESDLGSPDFISLWAPDREEEEEEGAWQGFVIGEPLGSGGMGTVYRARQLRPPREVALKMLHMGMAGQEQARHRLLAEAEALAELDHPGILPLYAAGEADGRAWLAMKLAGGGSLADNIGQWKGRWRDAAALIASIARAVQHAHERGVIHRDLKPANILFDTGGRAYVADFGLAKWLSGAHGQTVSAAVLGTPAYMAPEVARQGAAAATTASDVYGLGAVFYQLLTQRPLFNGPTPVETARLAATEEVVPPRRINPDVPRDLEAIVLKALQRQPAHRYSQAQAMAEDLENWLAGRPITARPETAAQRAWRWCRRHPLPAALMAAVVVVVAVSAVMLWQAYTRTRQALTAAEDRVAFMTGTLPAQLEPLGRLDVLDGVFADIEAYYEGMDGKAPDFAASQARKAAFQTQWAHILRRQGRLAEAGEKARRAVAAADLAIAESPDAPAVITAWAAARRRLAELDIVAGGFTDAFARLKEARAALETGLRKHAGHPALSVEKAETLNELGYGLLASGRAEESLAAYDEARAALESARLSDDTPPLTARRHRELQLSAPGMRGEALLAAKRFSEAVETYTLRLAAVNAACAAAPDDFEIKYVRTVALNRLADAYSRLPDAPLSYMRELWLQQEQGMAELCRHDPDNLQWRAEWGMAALAVAHGEQLHGDAAASRAWLEKALERFATVPARAHNAVLEAQANAALYLAQNLHDAKDRAQAEVKSAAAMEAAWLCLLDDAAASERHESFASRMRTLLEIHHAHAPERTPALIDSWMTRVAEKEAANDRAEGALWWLTRASLLRRSAALQDDAAQAAAANLQALELRARVLRGTLEPRLARQVQGDTISAARELAKSHPQPDAAAAGVRALLAAGPQFVSAGVEPLSLAVHAVAALLKSCPPALQAELRGQAMTTFFLQPPPDGSPLAAAREALLKQP